MKNKVLIIALLTPFKQNGDIDFQALKDYLDFLKQYGVKNIVTNGTTGEFASLTLEERKSILEFCCQNFEGTIVNNISDSCLKNCLELLKHSEDYADKVLALPPYYFANATEEGVELFFEEILKMSNLPVYLYNFPKHTQLSISPNLVAKLLRRHKNLAGLKDSSGKIEVCKSYKEISNELEVYIGSDMLTYDALEAGLDGSISGGGNPVPELIIKIYTNFLHGKNEKAQKCQRTFDIWNTFRKGAGINEIPFVKTIIGTRLNSFKNYVRPPFMTVNETLAQKVSNEFKEKIQSLLKGY